MSLSRGFKKIISRLQKEGNYGYSRGLYSDRLQLYLLDMVKVMDFFLRSEPNEAIIPFCLNNLTSSGKCGHRRYRVQG